MNKILRSILDNLDTVLIIALSIVAAIFGVFGGSQEVVLSAIAGTIGLVAYSIFRDREARQNLAKQVEGINSSLTSIQGRVSADDFFQTETSDSELLKQARQSVWIIQETGSKFIEDNFKTLENLANNGGKIRIILASPDDNILNLISFRNRNLQYTDLKARHDSGIRKLESLSQILGEKKDSLEVSIIQYPLDVTFVLVDAESSDYSNRKGLIRLAGFLDYFADKRDFSINYKNEPTTFQYFVNQFQKLWERSDQVELEIPVINS